MANMSDEDKKLREGHRQRMKKQFMELQNTSDFPDYQLLEMLLFYALPRVDTRLTAKRLLNEFDSFSGVFNADANDFKKVKGVTENLSVFLKLILTAAKRYHERQAAGRAFKSVKDYGDFLLEQYRDAKAEMMSMISLNSKYEFVSFDIISAGEADSVTVSAKKIVEKAIKKGVYAVIIAHNHPSGIAIPSVSDAEATITIKRLLSQVGVHLIDHVILESDDYVSMAQSEEYTHIF